MQPSDSLSIIPNSLTDSIRSTFGVQASTPIEILSAKAVKPAPLQSIELAAILSIESSQFKGSMLLGFPETVFLGVINRMLGESHQSVTSENADAAGELLNILYSSARVRINEAGHDFKTALPTVVRGSDINVNHAASALLIRIDCKCEFGPIVVEVSLKKAHA